MFAVTRPLSPAAKGVLASLLVLNWQNVKKKMTQANAQALAGQNKGQDEVGTEVVTERCWGRTCLTKMCPAVPGPDIPPGVLPRNT